MPCGWNSSAGTGDERAARRRAATLFEDEDSLVAVVGGTAQTAATECTGMNSKQAMHGSSEEKSYQGARIGTQNSSYVGDGDLDGLTRPHLADRR